MKCVHSRIICRHTSTGDLTDMALSRNHRKRERKIKGTEYWSNIMFLSRILYIIQFNTGSVSLTYISHLLRLLNFCGFGHQFY